MKAEDTVTKTTDENCHNTLEERLSEQAKITWDKAISEVVEWINSKLHSSYQDMWEDDWQAQVKEWQKESSNV